MNFLNIFFILLEIPLICVRLTDFWFHLEIRELEFSFSGIAILVVKFKFLNKSVVNIKKVYYSKSQQQIYQNCVHINKISYYFSGQWRV